MAKKKTKNNKKLVSFWCDPNEWEELPNNINCSKSEFLRQAVSNQIKKSDKITELRKKLIELENERQIIDLEIKDIKQAINEQENLLNDNANNINLIYNKMDIVRTVANNENGITEQRIKKIANDEIKPYVLINEARKQGINIIDKDKQTNSKIINPVETENPPENKFKTIIRVFKRNFKNNQEKYNNNALKFLESDKERFKIMCNKKGVDFKEFSDYVKNNFVNE